MSNLQLKPNEAGFIRHWLISGPKEEPYTTDYFNPNQLAFEKRLRESIADDNLKKVPEEIKLGQAGLDEFEWRYYPAFNNWFVDVSKFYFLLTKMEMYMSTVLCVPVKRQLKVRVWTFEAVELWVNGEKVAVVTEPVYKPIRYLDLELSLHAGENTIFVRAQDLGVRDTRNIFGLQIRDDFSDVTVKTPDFENVAPIIEAEQELLNVTVRNNRLFLAKDPVNPISINESGIWDEGAAYILPESCAEVKLAVEVGGTQLVRTVENSANDRPVYKKAGTLEECRERWFEDLYAKNEGKRNFAVTLAHLLEGRLDEEDFETVRQALPGIESRKDCADFELYNVLIMMLKGGHLLPEELKEEIKEIVLGFRYWMDEKGSDGMCFWSENHALGFYACQLMAGILYPDDLFWRSGRTGKEQHQLANSRCREWLDSIEATQFEEFLSPGYMPVTLSALFSLVDYGEKDVSRRAVKAADQIMEMLCTHFFDEVLIAPFGRIYGDVIKPFKQGILSSMCYFAKDIPARAGGKLIPLYELSDYEVSPHVFELMNTEIHKIYQTGNAQVHVCKTKDYMLTSVASERSESFAGGWSGEEARKENPYETGNFSFMYVKALNEKYHGTTLFQPGVYGYQQHMWSAALSNECVVMVNHPGATHQASSMRPGYWYGNGLFPALRQWDNVLLGIYSLDDKHPISFTHMYFPQHTFDEIRREGNWIFGRCGEGMLGVWCSCELVAHNDYMTDCEFRAFDKAQGYVCICSDLETEGSFEKFCSNCLDKNICFNADELTLNDGAEHEIRYVARYNDSQVI